MAKLVVAQGPLDQTIHENIVTIELEASHRSYLFPDLSADIDLTCTVTAGTSKAFGAWAELTDSGANKLSTIAEDNDLHITALRVRATSVADKLYVLEIGCGPSVDDIICIDPHDFGSGTKHIDSDEHSRFRPHAIQQGLKAYGRLKCETDSATATIVLRYHYD